MSTTAELAAWISNTRGEAINESALTCAQHAILDWLGVTLAGSREPVSRILLEDAIANGEQGESSVVGHTTKVSPTTAALLNGTASHALDFDDINKRMRGHPTVAILPAALAIAEQNNSSGTDLLNALVIGNQTACIVGHMLGGDHYQTGFHTTATAGTFGAAAAVAHLYRLDARQTAQAIGLAATQAAGLRSMFGTMAKPLHAGKAAMNGLLAARWARAGVTAHTGILEADQGFGRVFAGNPDTINIEADTEEPFSVENNIYKFHAACFYTHSAIDIVKSAFADGEIRKEDVSGIHVYLMPNLLEVCDIESPQNGLEIKFSIRHLLAMTVFGIDTADTSVYNSEIACDPELIACRELITVSPENLSSRTEARVRIDLKNATSREEVLDVGIPSSDLKLQFERLSAKYMALAGPVLGTQRAEIALERVSQLKNSRVSDLLNSISTE